MTNQAPGNAERLIRRLPEFIREMQDYGCDHSYIARMVHIRCNRIADALHEITITTVNQTNAQMSEEQGAGR